MDIKPNNPRDITPGRPSSGMPQRPRPLMSDFGPRRPTQPMPTPARSPQAQTPTTPPSPAPKPSTPPTAPVQPGTAHPQKVFARLAKPEQQLLPANFDEPSELPKQKHKPSFAGLVGLGVFLLLAALLLSPLVPGKIMDNFPGSSNSSSSGDTLACAHDLTGVSSTTTYNTKLGSPLVYKYATTTTSHGTCDGKTQTAVSGHTGQFSPLSGLVDILLAAGVAIGVTVVWRLIFGRKN